MTNQEGVNWVSVLSFLQKQQTEITMREKQWNLEKHQLQQKINRLQAELNANQIMITDLLNRIKLLEIALFESKVHKSKVSFSPVTEQEIVKIEGLLEKYKLESKLQDDHEDFLTEILSQIGIDSTEVLAPKSTNQKQNGIFKPVSDLKIKETGSISAHLDGVRKIFANSNKDFVVTVSEDCLVKVWSYANIMKNKHEHLQPAKTFREHAGPLFSLTGGPSPFHPQESIFFTGGSDGLVKQWKVSNKTFNSATPTSTWNCSKQSDANTTVWDLACNNNKLLSSSSDGYVNLFDINENEGGILKQQFKEKDFNSTCVLWMSSETFIQGCSNAPRAHVWDLTGKVKQKFLYQTPKGSPLQNHQINQINHHKNLKILAFGCEDGALRLYPTNFTRMIRKIQLNSSISCVKQLREWQLVCGTHSGGMSIWDLRNYMKILEFEKSHLTKYDEGILCLWTQADRIISGGADGVVRIFS